MADALITWIFNHGPQICNAELEQMRDNHIGFAVPTNVIQQKLQQSLLPKLEQRWQFRIMRAIFEISKGRNGTVDLLELAEQARESGRANLTDWVNFYIALLTPVITHRDSKPEFFSICLNTLDWPAFIAYLVIGIETKDTRDFINDLKKYKVCQNFAHYRYATDREHIKKVYHWLAKAKLSNTQGKVAVLQYAHDTPVDEKLVALTCDGTTNEDRSQEKAGNVQITCSDTHPVEMTYEQVDKTPGFILLVGERLFGYTFFDAYANYHLEKLEGERQVAEVLPKVSDDSAVGFVRWHINSIMDDGQVPGCFDSADSDDAAHIHYISFIRDCYHSLENKTKDKVLQQGDRQRYQMLLSRGQCVDFEQTEDSLMFCGFLSQCEYYENTNMHTTVSLFYAHHWLRFCVANSEIFVAEYYEAAVDDYHSWFHIDLLQYYLPFEEKLFSEAESCARETNLNLSIVYFKQYLHKNRRQITWLSNQPGTQLHQFSDQLWVHFLTTSMQVHQYQFKEIWESLDKSHQLTCFSGDAKSQHEVAHRLVQAFPYDNNPLVPEGLKQHQECFKPYYDAFLAHMKHFMRASDFSEAADEYLGHVQERKALLLALIRLPVIEQFSQWPEFTTASHFLSLLVDINARTSVGSTLDATQLKQLLQYCVAKQLASSDVTWVPEFAPTIRSLTHLYYKQGNNATVGKLYPPMMVLYRELSSAGIKCDTVSQPKSSDIYRLADEIEKAKLSAWR